MHSLMGQLECAASGKQAACGQGAFGRGRHAEADMPLC